MISVAATVDIDAPAVAILETVMDVERYRTADRKIRRVLRSRRDGDTATVTFLALLRCLPVLATQRMVLTPGSSVRVTNVPGWQDHLVAFEGRFDCVPLGGSDATSVTHAYRFDFVGPLRRPAEALLARWLDGQIHEEVQALKDLIEGRRGAGYRPIGSAGSDR